MTSSAQAEGAGIEAAVEAALAEVGAVDALSAALTSADLRALPESPTALATFLETHLLEALVGLVHPATAQELVRELSLELAGSTQSGTRARPVTGAGAETIEEVATVPPPASDDAQQAYEDLASGAIHDRATPAWGIRRVDPSQAAVWLVVSDDAALIELAKHSAPSGTDVIAATTIAVLKGALSRIEGTGCGILVDAHQPPIALDRTVAAITEAGCNCRVLLWRMPDQARGRLREAIPFTRGWIPCGDEVTPAELVQLLGS